MQQNSTKCAEYVQKLLQLVRGIQLDAQNWFLPLEEADTHILKLQSQIDQMKQIIQQMTDLKDIQLVGRDYTSFCLFIMYGNDMSNYLLARQKTNQLSRKHALRWQELALKFKSLLERKA